jgi:ABC-2 type transport system permease protein
MNKIDEILLKIVLLPQRLYQNAGIDVPKLKSILHYKLLMDDRSPNLPIFKRNSNDSQKKHSDAIAKFLITGLLGLLFLMAFYIGNDYITHLTFYFSFFITFLSLMLISDFTSVLIDVRDNFIIIPKPVNGKTVLLSRLLHILIHLSKTVFPLSISVIIYIAMNEHIVAALILFLVIVLATLFSIFFINAAYILILALTTPEKFKNIISYIQILFSIIAYAFSQLMPRLTDNSNYQHFDISQVKWAICIPFYWFACLFNWLFTFQASYPHMISGTLAVIIPLMSLYFIIQFLAPYFNQKLSMISGSEGNSANKTKGKNLQKIEDLFAKITTTNAIEKLGFLFSWKMMARSRDFKLKIYPAIGYVIVFIIITILPTDNEKSKLYQFQTVDGELSKAITIYIYSFTFFIYAALSEIAFSDKYKAAWMFYLPPIEHPGQLLSGSLKAIIVRFYLVIVFLFVFISMVFDKSPGIPNLFLAITNQLLLFYSFVAIRNKYIPFSYKEDRSNMFLKNILLLFLSALVGIVHYFIFANSIVIAIAIFVSLTSIYFISKYIKNLGWHDFERRGG